MRLKVEGWKEAGNPTGVHASASSASSASSTSLAALAAPPSSAAASSSTSRLDIDTLRGLACILLVSFHVVGVPDTGLRLPESHWLARINDALFYLRMPLFSFISGFVYAARPFQNHPGRFMQGKARRLLLPMLTLGTFYALVQRLTPGTNSDGVDNWWLLHIVPVAHFWFLESLFLIFLLVIALESLRMLARPGPFLLVFAVAALMFVFVRPPVYLGLAGATYLLPFFLSGLACRRFDIRSRRIRGLAAMLLLCALAWLATRDSEAVAGVLAGLVLSLSSAFLLLRSGWQVRWLAWIGGFSFAIYLMHVFFGAAARMFLNAIGVTDPYLHTLWGTAAGVLGPIAASYVIARSARLELWLLGKKPRPKVSLKTSSKTSSKGAPQP